VNILSNTSFIALLVTLALVSSCSKEEEKAKADASATTSTIPAKKMQPTPSTSVLPPNHPTTMPQNLSKASPQNMQQQAITPANPGQATVVKAMHASGYTYMKVKLGDRETWVAATSMRIKAGDTVKWESAAVMRNFTSKTLRRTFDEILFVSNASAVTDK